MPQLLAFAPELILAAGLILLFIADLALKNKDSLETVTVAALALALVSCFFVPQNLLVLKGAYSCDLFAIFFKILIFLTALLILPAAGAFLKSRELPRGEFYLLFLCSLLGMSVLPSANDLAVFYIALETMALSSYALAAYDRRDVRSQESGFKYFLLGAFNSGVVLYGIALAFGLTGKTSYGALRGAALASAAVGPWLAAFVFLLAGMAFKVALVPFHMWTPDVYEGAPTPVTGFISVTSKAASFAAILRILSIFSPALDDHWRALVAILAVLSMTAGNLLALVQTNVKRLMAYSSIAHAGYILIGFAAGGPSGLAGVLLYVFVYGFANLGIFSALSYCATKERRGETLQDLEGLSREHPRLALAVLVFFLSLAGIPPTGGFVGKLYLFASAIQANMTWLAVVGVLNSVLSLAYYFRVVMAIYFSPETKPLALVPSQPLGLALAALALATLAIGLAPGAIITWARASILPLL